MKKILLLLAIIVFVSCKNEPKSDENTTLEKPDTTEKTEKQSDGLTLLKGEFIYYADAAVLQTHNEMYGVVIDEKMHELNEQVIKYKTADTDMVPVEIRGKITLKPENEEGWNYRVEIKEILKVSKPNPEGSEIITIGKD
ncbi:hypothetical protein [Pontimicrobium sp. SW4]|uniref:NlpE C-terminal OB domain-containing protein n=1 Tax=Pontimicrobium sp. SW4 TaxID=3153519 RepID=A0AAU7BSU5_9FLAO